MIAATLWTIAMASAACDAGGAGSPPCFAPARGVASTSSWAGGRTTSPSGAAASVFGRRRQLSDGTQRIRMCAQKGKDADAGIVGKAAWVAAEALGNVARIAGGGGSPSPTEGRGDGRGVIGREEALERLRADYERSYFISGEVDSDLYAEDCLFAGSPQPPTPTPTCYEVPYTHECDPPILQA